MKKRLYILFILACCSVSALYAEYKCTDYTAMNISSSPTGSIKASPSGCTWTLTAVPAFGYEFYQWEWGTDNVSTDNPLVRTITTGTAKYQYEAIFTTGAFIDEWTSDGKVIVSTKSLNLTGKTVEIYSSGVLRSGATKLSLTYVGVGQWSFDVSSLSGHVGESLLFKFYDGEDCVVAMTKGKVPFVLTTNATLSSLSLASGTSIHVLSGNTLTIGATATLGDLDIYPGAIVKQTTGTLTVDKIFMRADATTTPQKFPQFYVNGTVTNNNADTIYYDYTLDYSHYYPLALPYKVACDQIRTKYGKTPSYEVRNYNGAERAKNVSGWEVYNDVAVGAAIASGQGYNVYAVPNKWEGGDGKSRPSKVTLRFPMYANLRSGEEATRYAPVKLYGTEGVTNSANFNWNLICNPYLCDYKSDITNLSLGYYKKNEEGEWELIDGVDNHRYVTWSEDNFLSYTQALVSSTTLKAFYPYFVQALAAGSLSFAKASRIPSAPQRAWMDEDEPIDNTEYPYGLILSGDNISDRTGLLYSDKFSQNYETNADLVKVFGEQQPMTIYSIGADNQPRAFNALPVEDAATIPVPLGYRNAPLGTMQIAFDAEQYDASVFDAVWLTDHQTNTTVNLLNEAYTFTNTQEASDTRFSVTVAISMTPAVVTDNEATTVGGQAAAVYYDMLGRRVNVATAPKGVYIVVEGGNSRKEVIR